MVDVDVDDVVGTEVEEDETEDVVEVEGMDEVVDVDDAEVVVEEVEVVDDVGTEELLEVDVYAEDVEEVVVDEVVVEEVVVEDVVVGTLLSIVTATGVDVTTVPELSFTAIRNSYVPVGVDVDVVSSLVKVSAPDNIV